MMAELDGELSTQQREEFDRLLAGDETLRNEWDKLRQVKEVTDTMGYREPPEEIWEGYWSSVYNRFERGVGWILASVGGLLVGGWGIWKGVHELLMDTGLPAFFKFGLFAMLFGGLILLFSVVREKWFTHVRDPYKEIQR